MKRLLFVAAALTGLLALAAHSQTVRVGAGGAPRETAAAVTRLTAGGAAVPKVLVIPGYGIHEEDGTQKEYVVPGYGMFGGT